MKGHLQPQVFEKSTSRSSKGYLRFNAIGGVNSIFAPTKSACSVAKYALYLVTGGVEKLFPK
jgi:hypothetical protein